jgi:hypothetical protein
MRKEKNQLNPRGEKHGLWEFYHFDRTVWRNGHFLHGKPHGLWGGIFSERHTRI